MNEQSKNSPQNTIRDLYRLRIHARAYSAINSALGIDNGEKLDQLLTIFDQHPIRWYPSRYMTKKHGENALLALNQKLLNAIHKISSKYTTAAGLTGSR